MRIDNPKSRKLDIVVLGTQNRNRDEKVTSALAPRA